MLRLKEVRKSKGLTQQDVAKYVGISQNNYSYWENGKVKIDNDSIKKLADLFNVSVDYLLGRDTPMPAPTDNTITEERLRALGINVDDFDKFSDEQLSAIRATLIALIDSFKKTNNNK